MSRFGHCIHETNQLITQEVLTSSRNVDDCEPLPHAAALVRQLDLLRLVHPPQLVQVQAPRGVGVQVEIESNVVSGSYCFSFKRYNQAQSIWGQSRVRSTCTAQD